MKLSEIGYMTDIVKPYMDAITACTTVTALVAEIEANWSELCPDALEQARGLTDADWQWALANKMSDDEADKVCRLAGEGLLPKMLMEIGFVAARFCVPDGCAYIRMTESGLQS